MEKIVYKNLQKPSENAKHNQQYVVCILFFTGLFFFRKMNGRDEKSKNRKQMCATTMTTIIELMDPRQNAIALRYLIDAYVYT